MVFGLTARFAGGFTAVSLLAVLVTGIAGTRYSAHLVEQAEERELNGRYGQFVDAINAASHQAEAMAAVVAGIPGIPQAVATGDRAMLSAMFVPGFKTMKQVYGVEQFQFHLPPATSFLRVHSPAKFGDDLTAIRKTIIRTNQVKAPTRGLEYGVAGLGIRGLVPLMDGGTHVGSVEFGLTFAAAFFERFKHEHGIDLALHVPDVKDPSVFKVFAGTFGDGNHLSAAEVAQAAAGQVVRKTVAAGGGRIAVLGRTVSDYSGEPLGVVEIAMDARDYAVQLGEARRTMVLVGLGAVLLASLAGVLIARGVARPVKAMTAAMDRIARRDFAVDLPPASGDDEISRMVRAVEVVRDEARRTHVLEQERAQAMAELAESQERLRIGMISQLKGVVGAAIETNEAGVVLAKMMGDVRQSASESQSMAAAVEEMVASVHTIAQNSEIAAAEAGEAEATARDGVEAAGSARGGMDAMMESVSDVSGKISALGEATNQIGAIIDQIEAIAAQTNLLALNATIEAARAGEAGKGFAVVASEVKGLATQTGKATEDIRRRIGAVTEEMRAAIGAMGQSEAAARSGRDAVDQVTGRLDSIAARVDGVTGHMRDIAGILGQQTAAAQEVSAGTARIAHLANANYQEIGAVLEAMANASRILDARVEEFAAEGGAQAIIEVAKNDHVRFKRSVVERLLDRSELTADRLADHHTCRLGKWYDAVSDERLRGHPAFGKLLDPHQRVHAHGKRALELHVAGHFDEASEEIDRLNQASHEVLALLDELGVALEG
ncbi:cache domain-containing protein [Magnetospirillum sp. UT-4]|uniref:methyl-accepting chemotaxis protein n=1 Tax=Magnetospirillum sp. UT-4 TaxID=2681467 RepID=UPI001383C4E6|nr:cache domain-containing protein [Magnetospirillum sp. UT-4]CAA7616437.1 Histidine kinase, HAMP region:Bacterial chemotaxis sensory transducer [Magnetospirillum sp. UT-4]